MSSLGYLDICCVIFNLIEEKCCYAQTKQIMLTRRNILTAGVLESLYEELEDIDASYIIVDKYYKNIIHPKLNWIE